jgi:putative intracellular protease/amidase
MEWVVLGTSAAVTILIVWLGVPVLLRTMGFHKHFVAPRRDLKGKRALVIATSHDTLGDTGKKTGVFASEMTAPYYTFADAGMKVDVASIKGGRIPLEPMSMQWPLKSSHDTRFSKDADLRRKVDQSKAISEIDASQYDAVFLAGGWGAAFDFEQSPALGALLQRADDAGAVIGGVCHGPLGLLAAKSGNGHPLLSGKRLTAVTDKQVRELGIVHTPRHPERDLRAAGAVFESSTRFRDLFASHVVADGRLVTGQNQNDGAETADRMMQVILATPRRGA